MKKQNYRVYAEVSTRCYLDVEASSEEEALQIGEDADGGDFISEEDTGDWSVYQAVLFTGNCPVCNSSNTRPDNNFPQIMRCCEKCGCDYIKEDGEIIFDPRIKEGK